MFGTDWNVHLFEIRYSLPFSITIQCGVVGSGRVLVCCVVNLTKQVASYYSLILYCSLTEEWYVLRIWYSKNNV